MEAWVGGWMGVLEVFGGYTVVVGVVVYGLPAGAGVHGHGGVHLEHQVPAGVQEEHRQGAHPVGDAAGFGDPGDDAHRPHDALDGGVVRGTHHLMGGGGGIKPFA